MKMKMEEISSDCIIIIIFFFLFFLTKMKLVLRRPGNCEIELLGVLSKGFEFTKNAERSSGDRSS